MIIAVYVDTIRISYGFGGCQMLSPIEATFSDSAQRAEIDEIKGFLAL